MLAPLNSTMLAVALSPISEEFDISTGWTTWLIAAYLIVMAVGQPISGRMGDMYGRRRLFIWGLVYFAAASALAMVSWNFPSLVFFRVQQAIGAAMFMSNGIAALRSSLPQESRGRAFGLMGGIIAMSAGIGPPLGGILVDGIGWRALFAVNLPVVLLALALSLKYLPKDLPGRSRQPLDVLGAGALATGLLALMIAATSLGREGAGDPLFWSMTLVFCASAAFFLWWEGHYSSPLISLAMFRRRSYAAGASTIFLSNMAMYALFIMVPLFVQDLKGDSPTRSGLALISLALFAILLSPLSGYVADRVGRNLPAVVGAVLLTLGAISITIWDTNSGMLYMVFSLGLFGVGLGVMQTPVQTAAIESCPPEMAGAASGTYATARYLGAIVATGLVGAFLAGGDLTEISMFRNLTIVLAVAAGLTIVSTINIHRWIEAPGGAKKEVSRQVS
ncbi:MAG: MFS transporter [Chloroflexi bacterium]|nr:MFS transporter [Chloroflexota bacterium]